MIEHYRSGSLRSARKRSDNATPPSFLNRKDGGVALSCDHRKHSAYSKVILLFLFVFQTWSPRATPMTPYTMKVLKYSPRIA